MADLKEIIIQKLEQSGVIDEFKAKLRQKVLQAVDSHSNKTPFTRQRFSILNSQDGQICVQLVRQFLQIFNLHSTLKILSLQLHMERERFSKKSIEQKLNFKSELGKPHLLSLIEKWKYQRLSISDSVSSSLNKALSPYQKKRDEGKQGGFPDPKPRNDLKLAPLSSGQPRNANPRGFDIDLDLKESLSPEIQESIQEDIQDSSDDYDQEVFQSAGGSSLGVDQSANSLALESLDYVEKVKAPRRRF